MVQPALAPINNPKQLLVEGPDDERFFGAFLRHLVLSDIQVRRYGGRGNIGNVLEVLADALVFDPVQSIGIVMDADNSAASALQSIRDNLRNAGLPAPADLATPAAGPPAVSAFVLPDNSGNGELEDLCLAALAEDPAMPCVDDFIQCIRAKPISQPRKPAKARMHAFLASRGRAYLRFGEFAESSAFPWHNPAFAALATFLRNL